MSPPRVTIALMIVAAIFVAAWKIHKRPGSAQNPSPQDDASNSLLPHDVYIWQRMWTPDVDTAIRAEHGNFRRLLILAGEISLKDNSVIAPNPNWVDLAKTVDAVGLVIRVGPLPASVASTAFGDGSVQIQTISRAALSAIASARTAGLNVAELQIDFDCAESKLAEYQRWVAALKNAVGPVPVFITVLPSWLKHSEFISLARACGGFVLQVHSLHRPATPADSMVLCDADETRRAIADARAAGVSFRLALPTYGYLAGFSRSGAFLGLAAEGAQSAWPNDAVVKTMRSDPAIIAGIVRDLMQSHSSLLTGIIWYRLPIAGDTLNWRLPTLKSVMAGCAPLAKLESLANRSGTGLTEIYLQNTGNCDAQISGQVAVRWSNAGLIAADGINAFDRLDDGLNCVKFRPIQATPEKWISPGDRLQIGWLRLSADTEVQTHVESSGQ